MTAQSEAKPVALKACPLADQGVGRMLHDDIPVGFWVHCMTCGLSTEIYETEEKAVDAWNRRPTVTEAEAREGYMKHIAGMYGADAPATEYEFGFWLAALRWIEGVGK